MDKEQKHIDDFLSDMVNDVPMSADGIGWADFNQKRKKKAFLWWPWMAAAGLLVCISFGYLWLSSDKSNNEIPVVVQSSEDRTTDVKSSDKQNIQPSISAEITNDKAETERSYVSKQSLKKTKTSLKPFVNQVSDSSKLVQIRVPKLLGKLPFFNIWQNHTYIGTVIESGAEMSDSLYVTKLDKPNTGLLLKINTGASLVNPNFVVSQFGQNRVHKQYESVRNAAESGAFGADIAFSLGFQRGRFQPYIGLGVAMINVIGNYDFTYNESPVVDVNGTIINYQKGINKQIQFKSEQRITAIQIPLALDFQLIKRQKFVLSLSQSLNANLILSTKGEAPNPVYLDKLIEIGKGNTKSSMLSYQVGFSVERSVNDRLSFYTQPYYSKNFGLKNTMGLYKSDLNAFGLIFGLKSNITR